jgi:hypothetical protein
MWIVSAAEHLFSERISADQVHGTQFANTLQDENRQDGLSAMQS